MLSKQYRTYYGKYSDKLEELLQVMINELNSINYKLYEQNGHKPCEHILSRIKDPKSLISKLERFELETSVENALYHMHDIVGVRIVTHFVGDVYDVLEEIKLSNKWSVVEIKDYIKNSKPNGYRSLHMLVSLPFGVGKIENINTEIQLRTIAQDTWAALEHQIKYKKKVKDINLITTELKRCADELASVDMSMQSIRDVINSQQ